MTKVIESLQLWIPLRCFENYWLKTFQRAVDSLWLLPEAGNSSQSRDQTLRYFTSKPCCCNSIMGNFFHYYFFFNLVFYFYGYHVIIILYVSMNNNSEINNNINLSFYKLFIHFCDQISIECIRILQNILITKSWQ